MSNVALSLFAASFCWCMGQHAHLTGLWLGLATLQFISNLYIVIKDS